MIAFSGEKFPDEYVNPLPEPERMGDWEEDFDADFPFLWGNSTELEGIQADLADKVKHRVRTLLAASRRSAIEECVAAFEEAWNDSSKDRFGGGAFSKELRSLLEGI
jgi:hypothetical protein